MCHIRHNLIASLILVSLCLPNCQLYHSCFAGDLLTLLNVSSDEKILPTTYGELRPPLGKHRLKVGLFIYYELNMQETNLSLITNLNLSGVKEQSCSSSILSPYSIQNLCETDHIDVFWTSNFILF